MHSINWNNSSCVVCYYECMFCFFTCSSCTKMAQVLGLHFGVKPSLRQIQTTLSLYRWDGGFNTLPWSSSWRLSTAMCDQVDKQPYLVGDETIHAPSQRQGATGPPTWAPSAKMFASSGGWQNLSNVLYGAHLVARPPQMTQSLDRESVARYRTHLTNLIWLAPAAPSLNK